ncbi:MAG: DUF423 domain-containing protein [Myxococcota bacterium]|nr:DUF423 domain-containing protein [Myxococcota bacterium]
MSNFIAIGAISAAISVAAGAFGAHGLRGKISDDMLIVFETGARYQMYHALGLILIGVVLMNRPSSALNTAGWLMTVGTLLFSGSLYGLALGGPRFLGPITPLGGTAFMIAWGMFAYAVLRS